MKKVSKRYAFGNAGKLISRKKAIDDHLSLLKTEYNDAPLEDCAFLLGKISAIDECRTALHKAIVEKFVATKEEIKEWEIMQMDTGFLKGYQRGLEYILNLDRQLFSEPADFVFYVYSESDDLINKYRLLFDSMPEFGDLNDDGLRYYLSKDSDDLCSRIESLSEKAEFIILVVYTNSCLPTKETMQKLAFGKHENVYLHKDSAEENLSDLVIKVLKATATL